MRISLNNRRHDWHKTNLVSIGKGANLHDTYTCLICGLKGNRYGLEDTIVVPDIGSTLLKTQCKPRKDTYIGLKIKIKYVNASAPQFENLKSGDIHKIVEAPIDYVNGDTGVWVMGIGEPVKILWDEFSFITERPKMVRTKFSKK